MSSRAIAPVIGASRETVRRDLAASDTDVSDAPREVHGRDRITRSDRPELVASFVKAGQDKEAIATKLNVNERTVRRDVSELVRTGHLSGCPCARSDRPELVWSFRKAGQKPHEIAAKLNVSTRTIESDTAKLRDEGAFDGVTITNSRGQERPAAYRKPEPPPTVNTDTGEVIDKHTGEVITRLPGHDAAKVPNGPIVSARVRAGPLPDKNRIYHRAARVGCT